MSKRILLNSGVQDYDTDYQSGVGAVTPATTTESPAGEDIHVLSRRVYGFDTPMTRDILRKANRSLDGTVRIPKI